MALKILKTNVGRLGLRQNIGKGLNIQSQNLKGKVSTIREEKLDFTQVVISDKLNKETHVAVRFLK